MKRNENPRGMFTIAVTNSDSARRHHGQPRPPTHLFCSPHATFRTPSSFCVPCHHRHPHTSTYHHDDSRTQFMQQKRNHDCTSCGCQVWSAQTRKQDCDAPNLAHTSHATVVALPEQQKAFKTRDSDEKWRKGVFPGRCHPSFLPSCALCSVWSDGQVVSSDVP